MFDDVSNKEYAIYAVETEVTSQNNAPATPQYHSFLIIAELGEDETINPIQELHFVHSERDLASDDKDGTLKPTPCLHGITKPANRDYSEMIFEKFASGSQEDMFAQWNKMTEIAGSLSAVRIKFTQNAGRDAVNCRTGTKAVLKALGHNFEPIVENAVSGVGAEVLHKIDDMLVDPTPRFFTPSEMQAVRDRFPLNLEM